MIGRQGPVDHFELVRWAREQATRLHTGTDPKAGKPSKPRRLRLIEAHVLLLLATYADEQAIAWPSIKTLADESGLRVKVRERPGREASYENSAISEALDALQDFGLIWSRQRGRRPVERELLAPASPEASAGLREDGRQGSGLRQDGGRGSNPGLRESAPGLRPRGGEEPLEEPLQKNQITDSARAESVGARSSAEEGPRKLSAYRHLAGDPEGDE